MNSSFQLSNELRTELISLLSEHPPLKERAGRDVWLMNLPTNIRELIPHRDDHHKKDLSFIIDSIQSLELTDGRFPILILIDALISETEKTVAGQKLKEVKEKIETELKELLPSSEPQKSDKGDLLIPGSRNPNRQLWLRLHNFKYDPFFYTEGGNDRYLSNYFHLVPNFFDILGDVERPQSSFIFGKEGSGKSSLRNVMKQLYCGDKALPIVYRKFGPLVNKVKKNQPVTIKDFVKEILRVAIPTLAKKQQPSLHEIGEKHESLQIRIWSYVMRFTRKSDDGIRQDFQDVLRVDSAKRVSLPSDYCRLFSDFCQSITRFFGYRNIYFLIDPDDDIAPDVNVAWQVLKPLLSTRDLLDIPDCKAAFKFFLNLKFFDPVLQIDWINNERTRRIYRPLEWTDKTFKALLKDRLKGGGSSYESLTQLSDGVNDLDDIVVEKSDGSPRKLITICNQLFDVHCSPPFNQEDLFITREEVNKVLSQLGEIEPKSKIDLLREQGEGSTLEFKATLRWNQQAGKSDIAMEKAVAKTLCGFMNVEGGTLIIGVDDENNIIGLDEDFSSLPKNKQNEDGFGLAFDEIVNKFLGVAYWNYISRSFDYHNGKRVYVIEIKKSREPCYCLFDQKHTFYIRVGASTRPLDAKETVEYIKENFKEYCAN